MAAPASALPGAPHTRMPPAAQACMSMALLRMPVVTSSRSAGSAWISSAGNGVRSRIATMTSKGCKATARAGPEGSASRNTCTRACAPSVVQSA
ncbi:Uncharacterised protein [Bordetella pertussis]|nr:Uncharacterised protein [Bordetella pertussis]CFO37146.1 Uncharacterised protein [Bordetella pertussis]CFO70481.1 Uncharacterised protein [Bordetella pertussis]CFP74018.1 Uncharacterised protein [Bordetella pertussis]CFP77533.1 Uncharacterised protein [Bordetella pertussis]